MLPANYRNLRDGNYDPSIDVAIGGVRMELWYYIDPATNEISPRPVTLGEVMEGHYDHLGSNPDGTVWVETGPDGQYHFTGLKPGNYIVLETQPDGFADSNDSPGSTTGFTFNSDLEASVAPSAVLTTFSATQIMDSVVNIRVNSGEVSVQNNFSEVRAIPDNDTPEDPRVPEDPRSYDPPAPPTAPIGGLPGLAGNNSVNFVAYIGGGRGAVVEALPVGTAYTWHLSVVNGGQPRGGDIDSQEPTWLQASYLSENDWTRFDMEAGEWTLTTRDADGVTNIDKEDIFFGMIGGTPLAGDFDGDGDDEMVLYKDGYWMIDINGNGLWDIDDLMARLGNEEDRPVVGDWDGDGKDDIGNLRPNLGRR